MNNNTDLGWRSISSNYTCTLKWRCFINVVVLQLGTGNNVDWLLECSSKRIFFLDRMDLRGGSIPTNYTCTLKWCFFLLLLLLLCSSWELEINLTGF